MKEADESVMKPCSYCKVDIDLVKKLNTISDYVKDKCLPYSEELCGWSTSDSDVVLQMMHVFTYPAFGSQSTTRLPLDDPSKKTDIKHEKSTMKEHEMRMRKKKKRHKIDPGRLNELSAPRRVREKVKIPTVNRVLLPFNETSTFSSANSERRCLAKIAFQYRKSHQDPLKYLHGSSLFPGQQAEHTKFAIQRKSIEHSLHEFILSKSRSQSTSSLDKFSKIFEPPVLARTHENSFVTEHERVSDASFSCPPRGDVNLPLPQANLFNTYTDHTPTFDAYLPPIKQKKSQIGSITAISDGNRKVGIKSNSIKKLGRHPVPQPPLILPRLAGSKMEVPLLPRSPDFLHRML